MYASDANGFSAALAVTEAALNNIAADKVVMVLFIIISLFRLVLFKDTHSAANWPQNVAAIKSVDVNNRFLQLRRK